MAGADWGDVAGALQAGAQLQPPHVSHHSCGVKRLLRGRAKMAGGQKIGMSCFHTTVTLPMSSTIDI